MALKSVHATSDDEHEPVRHADGYDVTNASNATDATDVSDVPSNG